MSNHNYSQYSKKNHVEVEPTETTVVEDVAIPAVDVSVTPAEIKMEPNATVTAPESETITGTVVNCAKLNVRVKPDATAKVIRVIDAASEVEIDVEKSNKEWFKVRTETGVIGYCMRKFINASL